MAALSIAIEEARRNRATRENRDRQNRAELRLEEICMAADIPSEFQFRGRARNVEIENLFGRIYRLADDEAERSAAVRAFMAWEADEKHEQAVIEDLAGQMVQFQKDNNPTFIEGAFVPGGSDGAA